VKARFVAGVAVSLLLIGKAQACRIPRTSEADFGAADAVVHGLLLAPDPACMPQSTADCGKRIIVDRVVKGQANPIVTLRSDLIIIGCSQQNAEPGQPAFFFLSLSDGRYVVFRSEKDDR
jgi:hypothetical protein